MLRDLCVVVLTVALLAAGFVAGRMTLPTGATVIQPVHLEDLP